MSLKKFVTIFVVVITLFVLYNFTVWNLYTKKILSGDLSGAGDMARMGYLTEFADNKESKNTLPLKVIEAYDYNGSEIDMITMGDSFSQGGGGGLNNHYQDHISTKTKWKVLNLGNFQDKTRSYIETAYLLGNSGFLEKSGVKYILIESVQRKVVQRFISNFNPDITESIENINQFYNFTFSRSSENEIKDIKKTIDVNYKPATPFINNGNLKVVLYSFLYNFSNNAYISNVHKVKLTEELFTLGDRDLLFYHNDLTRIDWNSRKNLSVVNDNLNILAKYLKKLDIKLVFMPAVNKYDLYSSFIKNNPYTIDQFFPNFRDLKKEYIFIDTKGILLEKLKKGVKDIFYIDDSHWSGIASNLVSEEIIHQIKKEEK